VGVIIKSVITDLRKVRLENGVPRQIHTGALFERRANTLLYAELHKL
jgi:hypothetical protein